MAGPMTKLRALLLPAALIAVLFTFSSQLLSPQIALAQDGEHGDDADPASSRSATFQAVEGPSTEDVPGAPFLVAAYGTILVLLVGYVGWIARLESGTARELDRLRRVIDRGEAKKIG